MRSIRLWLTALSCGLTTVAFGCNAVLGLDKLSVGVVDAGTHHPKPHGGETSAGGSGGAAGEGSGGTMDGTGGAPSDAASDAPVGDCTTNDVTAPANLSLPLESIAPEMKDGFFIVPRLATHEDSAESGA